MNKCIAAILLVLSAFSGVASAQITIDPNGTMKPTPICIGQQDQTCVVVSTATPLNTSSATSYQLLSNASASGAVQANVLGSGYIWNVTGTFGGATITLNVTDAAGVQQPVQVCTLSPCNVAVNIGQGSSVQAVVSGGSPSGLYARLAGLGGPLLGLSTPLPTYQTWPATANVVTTTVSTTTASTSANYTPLPSRPIWYTISGTWAGNCQVFRSIDGGTTRLPLTYIDGSSKGSFTTNVNAPIATENEAVATYSDTCTLTSGSATRRFAQ